MLIGSINAKNHSGITAYYQTSIDTLQIINRIKKLYKETNSKIITYSKIKKDIQDQSEEGGVVVAYYDNKDLKKIIATYYGETGKVITEYYFYKDSIFFILNIEYFYNKPIYIKSSTISSIQENRYYFYKNQLLQWINSNKHAVGPSPTEYQEKSTFLLSELETLKKALDDNR